MMFLYIHAGKEFLPDEIKEQAWVADVDRKIYRVKCSHASTGRMLRRSEQRGDEYMGLRLCRGSRRNVEDNEDLTTYYLAS